ncbi:RIP metalloprotease RseP [Paratissierella segnis]|jgi:regulator of sigma E protease|uniref:Zinc metalloprotease n=1 Tax=Paratissierella segnis TaxID=2763679 RepID=A0A926ILL7_9FIRM|nr:RIP metalloprotease RseP [Paratissierella segnis]MBC8588793.1 RIP metalloprotease RseP [Paratissierella segnis]
MQTAIASIFVFLLVILLHEFGHFTVAKLVGIRVNEFSVGMGPKLLQKKSGETLYTLRALPIGGYVQMEGEDEESNDPRGFNNAPIFARIATVTAGAIMNFILAFVVFSIVSFSTGMPTTAVKATPNSPAEVSGILEGDRIISVNGIDINSWNDITDTVSKLPSDQEVRIEVLRDGKEEIFNVMPTTEENRTIIGITPVYEKSFLLGLKGGLENTWTFLKLMFEFIEMLFKGQVSINDFSGPVGVINEVGQAAKGGFLNLLVLLGFISVNLGFFNLLPIPALDGSKILFLLIELIRGKPIDPKKEGFVNLIGFAFLISFMLIITYKDILRLFY